MPPLDSEGDELVCESVCKADLMSDHFDSKQSREAVDLPLTNCIQVAHHVCIQVERGQASLVRLVPLWWTDIFGYVFFLKELLMLWSPRLSVVFQQLVRQGCFLAFGKQGKVTPIPIGPPSTSVAN